jgi:hypothetical protein
MACDLDPILALAKRHNLKVVEDCAHSLGAQYKGQMVGTHGDAAFFSFQAFKPLNTFGGGLTWVRDAGVARRVSEFADAEAWPEEKRVERFSAPVTGSARSSGRSVYVFDVSVWWAASFTAGSRKRLWGRSGVLIRCRRIIVDAYERAGRHRPGRSQAPARIERTRHHAGILNELLGGVPGITVPSVPEGRTRAYYQYCAQYVLYQRSRETLHSPRRRRRAHARRRLYADGVVRLGWSGCARRGDGDDRSAGARVRIAVRRRSGARWPAGPGASAESRTTASYRRPGFKSLWLHQF